jgi:MYXO-CTERM domain-containing protein
VGSVADTFSLTTVPADTTPEAFSFTDQTGVAFNTVVTSDTVTITGINTGTPISVSGGEYSVNGGAFTNVAGSVTPGAQVRVRQTSSGTATTTTNTVLTVGGVSDTFAVTTANVAPDTQPDAFVFNDVDNADLSTVVESNTVTITGINVASNIAISGPGGSSSEYRINGGAWTSAAGTISNNDTLQVRHTTSAVAGDAIVTVVTIGNASPAPSSQRRQAEFSSLTTPPGDGGSSSMDGLALGLLGALALVRRRRTRRA